MVKSPRIVSELFETFADPRRRRALARLAEHRRMTLADLAATLDGGQRPVEHRRLRVELHHVHVPKLAASGLVDYEPERGVVVLTDRGRNLASWLSEACDALPDSVGHCTL